MLLFFSYFIGTGSDVQVPKRHKTSRPSQGSSRPSLSHSSAFSVEDQDTTSLSENRKLYLSQQLSNNNASGSQNNNLEPHSTALVKIILLRTALKSTERRKGTVKHQKRTRYPQTDTSASIKSASTLKTLSLRAVAFLTW